VIPLDAQDIVYACGLGVDRRHGFRILIGHALAQGRVEVIPLDAQDVVYACGLGVDWRHSFRILIGHAPAQGRVGVIAQNTRTSLHALTASRHLRVASLPASQRRRAAEGGIVASEPRSAAWLLAIVENGPRWTTGKPSVGTRRRRIQVRRSILVRPREGIIIVCVAVCVIAIGTGSYEEAARGEKKHVEWMIAHGILRLLFCQCKPHACYGSGEQAMLP
jgi:hypothetical protein